MANRNFDNSYVLGKGRVTLQGSFAPNGTSAPTGQIGNGWSVTRTGVGTFVVQLQDRFNRLESCGADLSYDAATSNWAQFGPIDVTTAGTVTIFIVNNAGALTDITANAARRVNFTIDLINSGLP